MLPGSPLWPYGTFSGSTSIVFPLGRNVTLYFFVAGLYLASSIYGFVPPISYSPKATWFVILRAALFAARRISTLASALAARQAEIFCCAQDDMLFAPYHSRDAACCASAKKNPTPLRACALREPSKLRCSSALPQDVRLRDSVRRCSCV